jgi:hypothetical protein
MGVHECNDGASKTPPNGADGLEFVRVVSIFVKGKEVQSVDEMALLLIFHFACPLMSKIQKVQQFVDVASVRLVSLLSHSFCGMEFWCFAHPASLKEHPQFG